ncbi:MAG: methyltransferase domain-containing protein [Chloroflexota bacterium]|nr:methyltransferase domain-containing protein [Chloroflexota bacterium]
MSTSDPQGDPYAAIAELYAAEHDDWDDDLPMYVHLAERAGGPIMDLACGTARVGTALAAAGFEVHGVDASAALLAIARRRADARGVGIELQQGDMRHLRPTAEFGAVICALDSFLHLESTHDQLLTLEGARGLLRSGGVLAVDVFNPTLDRLAAWDGVLRTQGGFRDADGISVTHFVSWEVDPGAQRIDARHIYDVLRGDGQVTRRIARMPLRYVHRFELELALRCAGFERIETYGSWALDPYDGEGDRLIVVATKT